MTIVSFIVGTICVLILALIGLALAQGLWGLALYVALVAVFAQVFGHLLGRVGR